VHQANILTKHNCPPSSTKPSVVEKILDGVQFNLETEATLTVISDKKNDPNYKRLEQERIEWLEDLCNTSPCELMLSFVLHVVE
jgi:hypothetical protein